MSRRWVMLGVMVFLSAAALSQAAYLLEDFESYTLTPSDPNAVDPNDVNYIGHVWKERNPVVGTIEVTDVDHQSGNQCMKYTFHCENDPFWSEVFTILPDNIDISGYKTLNFWIRGKTTDQADEDMYIILYTVKDPGQPVVDHTNLSMLGKSLVFKATKFTKWRNLRFPLNYNYEQLKRVRAIGFGMHPVSYGQGFLYIDSISFEEKSFGGLINDFEDYESTEQLLAASGTTAGYDFYFPPDANQTTVELEMTNPENIFAGEKSLKISYDNSLPPYFSKVAFYRPLRIHHVWTSIVVGGLDYNPLTIHFKIEKPQGNIRVALIDFGGNATAVYDYPDPDALKQPTDWIRWDIDPRDVYNEPGSNFEELYAVRRIEVQFTSGDYGTGVAYLDNLSVNICGQGWDNGAVGDLDADFNKDCTVDLEDLSLFALQWLKTGCNSDNKYCQGADFSYYGVRDGKVNIADLAIFTTDWLRCNMFYEGDCFEIKLSEPLPY